MSHKATSPDRYIDATVTHTDIARSNKFTRPEAAGLLPFDAGYIYVAAQRNAAAVAGFTPRLYVPSKSTAKRINRRKSADLKNAAIVGRKAAMYASRADDVEEITNHPVLDLLDNPNPHWSGTEMILLDQRFLELTGNAFNHVVTSGGEPSELWPMFAQYVQVVVDDRNFVVGWFYGRESSIVEPFDADEVIQHRFPSIHNPYYGQSWVSSILANAVHYNQTMQAQTTLMENDARPDYAILAKSPLSKEQTEALELKIDEKHRGPDKKRRPLFLSGSDYSIIPLSFSPEDLAIIEQLKWDRDTIAAASGVPVSMLTVEDVNRSNAAEGNIQYLRSTIMPRLALRADVLTTKLLPMYGYEPGEAWFAYDNPVPEDEEREARIVASLVSGGIITPNEARAEQGLEPIVGGETLVGSVGSFGGVGDVAADPSETSDTPALPIFDAAKTTAVMDILLDVSSANLAPDAAITMLVSLVGIEADAARAMVEAQVKAKEEASERADQEEVPGVGETEDGDVPPEEDGGNVASDDDRTGKSGVCGCGRGGLCESGECGCNPADGVAPEGKALTAPGFVRAIRSHFKTQAGLILQSIDKEPGAIKALETKDIGDAVGQWFIDARLWDDSLAESSKRWLDRAMMEGAGAGAAELRKATGDTTLRVSIDVDAPKIREIVKANTTRYVRSVNDETERLIREAVLLADPNNPADVKRKVREAFAGMSKGRSEMIARTETARFVELGKVEQWKDTDVVKGKRWLLSPDPCEVCKAVASQSDIVPVGDAFFKKGDTLGLAGGGSVTFDYEDVDGPPAHPGCRCTMVPVVEGVNE